MPFLTCATERLSMRPLTTTDAEFIFELVNTDGWLRFIGNRNISSATDAVAYIERILGNKNITYWVAELKDDQRSIGIVTYIKRDYLEHHDIGFAFLPAFSKKGYAYEATSAVLDKLVKEQSLRHILATTIPANTNSIRLLNRMGLVFEKEIKVENDILHVYGREFPG